ncbi:MAG: hypothetical protein HOH82_13845, partial [Planctomycetaceae bacterium]|nr:hypothetical protein [Planctomycetaceae bacterium]
MDKQSSATQSRQSELDLGTPTQKVRKKKKRPARPSPQQVIDAFDGDIEPVQVGIGYRLGILLVAFFMLLLPLLYVGIIGLAAYGVYWHAASNVDMFSGTQGRGVVMVFLVYLTPMIIGGILVVFMFKPLFSRSPHSERWRSLTRDDQPLLFAFVERICDAVGAAHPSRINLDVQVNASASFRRGWLSFLGNDLVLTIGMPLVAGMSTRQFAGVLAHEFGHFSQGAGMRLTYVPSGKFGMGSPLDEPHREAQ